MGLIDLGKKQESGLQVGVPTEAKSQEAKMNYPSFYIDGEAELPFDEEDAGKTFNIEGVVRVRSITKRSDGEKKTKDINFDLLKIGIKSKSDKRNKLAKVLKAADVVEGE